MTVDFWQTFLREMGAYALALAAIGWLIKALFSQSLNREHALFAQGLNKELDAYRAQLSAATLAHTEQLKAAFTIAAKEHEIRFGTLHSRRTEALLKIFAALQRAALLARTMSAIADMPGFAAPGMRDGDESLVGQTQSRTYADLMTAGMELRQQIGAHRLLLGAELIERLRTLAATLEEPSFRYMFHYTSGQQDNPESLRASLVAFRARLPEIDSAIAVVEDAFRRLLGSADQT